MQKLRIGIVGYGNIGRGVEKAVAAAPDMELTAVVTRRAPKSLQTATQTAKVIAMDDILMLKGEVDVLLLCGGSATDLPVQGPQLARDFNIVDSFDTHAKIPEYLKEVDAQAQHTTAVISSGWDPGLFSIIRALSGAVLPDGTGYTFWGKGVSQGHSDAIRRVKGVAKAVQYTVPVESAVDAVRGGQNPVLTTRQRHLRDCWVVAEAGADLRQIERDIQTMPHYFADYDTTVHFIDEADFAANHTKMPHGGKVFHGGNTGENRHMIEFSLTLDSNPEFTGSVMVAYARAAARMAGEGLFGAKTVLDIQPVYLSLQSRAALIQELL